MANISDFVNGISLREREELEKSLVESELIRWARRPFPQLWCPESVLFFAVGLMSLPGLAFVAYWMFDAFGLPSTLDAADPFLLIFLLSELPMLGFVLYLLSAPWRRARKLRRSLYVITNRRALVLEPALFSWKMLPFALSENMVCERHARADGRGDLVLGMEHRRTSKGGTRTIRTGFMSLENLAEAEQALQEAIRAQKGEQS